MPEEYGIRISAEGYDQNDTDPRNILLSSEFPMFKYHSDSTASLTINSGNTTGSVNISHSLGYIPAFVAYVSYPFYSSYQRMLPAGRVPLPQAVSAFATSSNITCKVVKISEGSNRTYNFRVIIFKDQLI